MKFLARLKNSLITSFTSNTVLIISSVVIAIILWFIISITIYPTTPKTLSNIPIEIDVTGTSAEANGLSVISYETKKVNVTIKGDRSSIGSLSSEDFKASPIIENVTSAGEKILKISVKSNKPDIEFEVTDISPSTMTVMFDRIDTRKYELSVVAPNIKAAEGLYMDSGDFSCSPSTIEISGPSTLLDKIDKSSVLVNDEKELETAYTFHSSDIVLYDKNDSKIDTKNLSFNVNDFTVEIPVYTQRELSLSYNIRYAPSNFDLNSLGLELNVDSINLASPNTDLQKIDSWNIGDIPLYDIDWDYNESFQLDIPENYKNLSNISTITAKLNTEGLAKKTVTVNDISIVNAPTDYDCSVKTYGIVFDIIGPEEDIEEITEKDIIVSVDLLKYNIQSSNFTADATISFPNYSKVWAVGLQKVSVEATAVDSEE